MMAAFPIPAIKRRTITVRTVPEAAPINIPWFEKSSVPVRF